jgi:O-acetylhomoserine (thiol)-lyase
MMCQAFEAADRRSKTKAIFIESDRQSGRCLCRYRTPLPLWPAKARHSIYRRQHHGHPLSRCQPFKHGADIVVHSLTKFIGGHGNSMGGIIVDGGSISTGRNSDKFPKLSAPRPDEYHGMKLHEALGGNFAFAIACRVLGLRDLGSGNLAVQRLHDPDRASKRLPLRMQRHCDNALEPSPSMAGQSTTRLPGSLMPALKAEHEYHALQQKYSPKGGGAVFTFGLKGGHEAGVKLVEGVKTLLASGQYRRHALADYSSGFDHP